MAIENESNQALPESVHAENAVDAGLAHIEASELHPDEIDQYIERTDDTEEIKETIQTRVELAEKLKELGNQPAEQTEQQIIERLRARLNELEPNPSVDDKNKGTEQSKGLFNFLGPFRQPKHQSPESDTIKVNARRVEPEPTIIEGNISGDMSPLTQDILKNTPELKKTQAGELQPENKKIVDTIDVVPTSTSSTPQKNEIVPLKYEVRQPISRSFDAIEIPKMYARTNFLSELSNRDLNGYIRSINDELAKIDNQAELYISRNYSIRTSSDVKPVLSPEDQKYRQTLVDSLQKFNAELNKRAEKSIVKETQQKIGTKIGNLIGRIGKIFRKKPVEETTKIKGQPDYLVYKGLEIAHRNGQQIDPPLIKSTRSKPLPSQVKQEKFDPSEAEQAISDGITNPEFSYTPTEDFGSAEGKVATADENLINAETDQTAKTTELAGNEEPPLPPKVALGGSNEDEQPKEPQLPKNIFSDNTVITAGNSFEFKKPNKPVEVPGSMDVTKKQIIDTTVKNDSENSFTYQKEQPMIEDENKIVPEIPTASETDLDRAREIESSLTPEPPKKPRAPRKTSTPKSPRNAKTKRSSTDTPSEAEQAIYAGINAPITSYTPTEDFGSTEGKIATPEAHITSAKPEVAPSKEKKSKPERSTKKPSYTAEISKMPFISATAPVPTLEQAQEMLTKELIKTYRDQKDDIYDKFFDEIDITNERVRQQLGRMHEALTLRKEAIENFRKTYLEDIYQLGTVEVQGRKKNAFNEYELYQHAGPMNEYLEQLAIDNPEAFVNFATVAKEYARLPEIIKEKEQVVKDYIRENEQELAQADHQKALEHAEQKFASISNTKTEQNAHLDAEIRGLEKTNAELKFYVETDPSTIKNLFTLVFSKQLRKQRSEISKKMIADGAIPFAFNAYIKKKYFDTNQALANKNNLKTINTKEVEDDRKKLAALKKAMNDAETLKGKLGEIRGVFLSANFKPYKEIHNHLTTRLEHYFTLHDQKKSGGLTDFNNLQALETYYNTLQERIKAGNLPNVLTEVKNVQGFLKEAATQEINLLVAEHIKTADSYVAFTKGLEPFIAMKKFADMNEYDTRMYKKTLLTAEYNKLKKSKKAEEKMNAIWIKNLINIL